MRIIRISLSLAFLAISSLAAFANDYGAIRGVMHDPQHRPVQGAMVMLRAKSSDWAKSATTDANGEFQFNAVLLGEYSITVAGPGFAQAPQNVIVISGSEPVVHFQLQIAGTKDERQRFRPHPKLFPPIRSLPPRSSAASTSPALPAPTAPTAWP